MSRNAFLAPGLGGSVVAAVAAAVFIPSGASANPARDTDPMSSEVRVAAPTPVEAGRYLIRVAGCNDCHTPDYMQLGARVPEERWLTGGPLGWRGPWGTTYATNLRLFVQETPEDVWLSICEGRATRPPMPWDSLHFMSEADRKAIYAYIRHLGPAGEKMPAYCEPGVEPTTPYVLLDPDEMGFRRVYAQAPEAGLVAASECESFEAMGLAVRVRVPSTDTRDALSLVELTLPDRAGTPPQSLLHHDLIVDVAAGAVEVVLAGRPHAVSGGDRVVVPRGTHHVVRNTGHEPARVHLLTTPGGFDEFLRELATIEPEDEALRQELCESYGVRRVAQ